MMENLEIFGGLAIFSGVVIMLFPKIFFYLIGLYMVGNAALAFFQEADPWLVALLGVGGILIFIAPKMVAWMISVLLIVVSLLAFFNGLWILAVPGLVLAVLVLLAPKIVPLAVGGV